MAKKGREGKTKGDDLYRLPYNNPKILQSIGKHYPGLVKSHGFLKVLISLNVTKIV